MTFEIQQKKFSDGAPATDLIFRGAAKNGTPYSISMIFNGTAIPEAALRTELETPALKGKTGEDLVNALITAHPKDIVTLRRRNIPDDDFQDTKDGEYTRVYFKEGKVSEGYSTEGHFDDRNARDRRLTGPEISALNAKYGM